MKASRAFRILGFLVIFVISLVLLAIAVENVRGKRAWLQYKSDLEARGEQLDWEALRPSPVPDDENFARTPLLAGLHNYTLDPKTRKVVWAESTANHRATNLFRWRPEPPGGNGWRLGQFADLAAWQQQLRAQTNSPFPEVRAVLAQPAGSPGDDALALLAQNAAELEEIRQASRRPHSLFMVHSEETFFALMPELAVMKSLSLAFRFKALAELASNRPDAAAADLQSCLEMADKLRDERVLIAGLVQLAILESSVQPLWEGLARRQWTDPQLAQLQAAYEHINVPAEMARSLRGECAFSLATIDLMKSDPAALMAPEDAGLPVGVLRYMPSGWIYQNQRHIARAFHEYLLPTFQPESRRVTLVRDHDATDRFNAEFRSKSPYRLFASMLVPAYERVPSRTVQTQAALDLAVVACALERQRLAQGAYPEQLDALSPRFLTPPRPDPVNGEPLKYRRTDDGRFLLYSVGLNGKDDHGVPARTKKGDPDPRSTDQGDWVWAYGS